MISLNRIAELVDGIVVGDKEFSVKSIKSLENATRDSITFFVDQKKKDQLSSIQAGAILISKENAKFVTTNKVMVDDPYLAYARISGFFREDDGSKRAVDSTAIIANDVQFGSNIAIGQLSTIAAGTRIGNDVSVGDGVHLGKEVKIGDGTIIENRVVISPGCQIGKRCWISPGAVIGASGFGYAPDNQRWEKIEQLGSVEIGDDVDVGANTTIDRGALENTVIENGVKLDNQIQIAHNVRIGENSIMAGCVGIAGSAKIGKRCRLGARVTVLGHLEITDDVTVFAGSFVANSIKSAGEYASTISVQPIKQWRKNVAIFRRLENLVEKVKKLGR